MRFFCNSCQTKYSIADEKVRGKILKIRCKKCGAIIVVREEQGASAPPVADDDGGPTRLMNQADLRKVKGGDDAEPGQDDAPKDETPKVEASGDAAAKAAPAELAAPEPAAPPVEAAPPDSAGEEPRDAPPEGAAAGAPADEVEWFAMIAGQQEGPFTVGEIRAKLAEGTLTGRTYVWNENLPDWQRASDVASLQALLAAKAAPAPAPKRQPLPAPEPAAEAKPKDDDASSTATTDPAGKLPAENEVREPAVRAKSSPSIASTKKAPVADPFAAVPDSPLLEDVKPGEQTRFFMAQAGVDKTGHRKRAGKIVAIAGAALAAVAAAVLFAPVNYVLPSVPQKEDGQPATEAPVWTAEGVEELRAKLLGTGGGESKKKGGRRSGGSAGSEGATAQAAPAPSPKDDGGAVIKRDEPKPKSGPSDDEKRALEMLGSGPQLKDSQIAVKGADAPKADKANVDQAAIGKTIADNAGSYKRCMDDHLRRNPKFRGGRVEITATIAPSGIVTAAQLSDRSIDSTDLGTCIKDRTKRIIFPKFEGEPFDVTYPLVLASGGG